MIAAVLAVAVSGTGWVLTLGNPRESRRWHLGRALMIGAAAFAFSRLTRDLW